MWWWQTPVSNSIPGTIPQLKQCWKIFLSILLEKDFWSSWYLHHNLLRWWICCHSFQLTLLKSHHIGEQQQPVSACIQIIASHLIPWQASRSLMIWTVASQIMKAIILLPKSVIIPLVVHPPPPPPWISLFCSPSSAKLVLKILHCAKGIHRHALSMMWQSWGHATIDRARK